MSEKFYFYFITLLFSAVVVLLVVQSIRLGLGLSRQVELEQKLSDCEDVGKMSRIEWKDSSEVTGAVTPYDTIYLPDTTCWDLDSTYLWKVYDSLDRVVRMAIADKIWQTPKYGIDSSEVTDE